MQLIRSVIVALLFVVTFFPVNKASAASGLK